MLLILLTAVFFVLRILPGDPVLALWGSRNPPPEVLERARQALGLDKPIWVQYTTYLSGVFRGDFGTSIGEIYLGRPVLEEIGNRLPATVEIAIGSMVSPPWWASSPASSPGRSAIRGSRSGCGCGGS
jgi:peptide/nickel transport system permease protein